jgi:hypothetical protein
MGVLHPPLPLRLSPWCFWPLTPPTNCPQHSPWSALDSSARRGALWRCGAALRCGLGCGVGPMPCANRHARAIGGRVLWRARRSGQWVPSDPYPGAPNPDPQICGWSSRNFYCARLLVFAGRETDGMADGASAHQQKCMRLTPV